MRQKKSQGGSDSDAQRACAAGTRGWEQVIVASAPHLAAVVHELHSQLHRQSGTERVAQPACGQNGVSTVKIHGPN